MKALVKIATFQNALDAHLARSRLEAEGLQAFIEGENANLALSYVGSAVGGVRLLVHEEDSIQALSLLQAGAEKSPTGVQWLCTTCGETVDAGFDLCWQCGADRSAVAATDQPEPAGVEHYTAQRPLSRASINVGENPFAPPLTPIGKRQGKEVVYEDSSATELLELAFRRAVIGLFFAPLAAMSLWSLAEAYLSAERWSAKNTRTALWTLLINLLNFVLVTVLLREIIASG